MFSFFRWIAVFILLISSQLRAANPMVFCFQPATVQPGLTAMTMVSTTNNTPAKFVALVAAGFSHYPQAQRCLCIRDVLTNPQVFATANLKSTVENGPNCTSDTRYLTTVFTQMKAQNLIPTRIVLDLEQGFNTWVLWPANGSIATTLMPIYDDPVSLNKLPASLQPYSPSDFANYTTIRGAAATNAWNAWNAALVAQALRQTVANTANTIFQTNIPTTDYEDILPSFPVYDLNNWPLPSAAVSNESSPDLYIAVEGTRYIYSQKDVRWNRFIDALNHARSAIRNGPVVPWIAYPSYAGDSHLHANPAWLWREEVRHLNAMGITTYLFFDPGADTVISDDQYASKTFQSTQTVSNAPINYPPIPLDADTVTTGTITSTYEDFLSNLLGGASAIMK